VVGEGRRLVPLCRLYGKVLDEDRDDTRDMFLIRLGAKDRYKLDGTCDDMVKLGHLHQS